MTNNNLLLVLAGAGVLYYLHQKGQTAVTTAPANTLPATGTTVPAGTPAPQGIAIGEFYPSGGGGGVASYVEPINYGRRGGGGDPYAAERQKFLDWIDSIPLGIDPNDPRLKPAVINVNDL